MRRLAVIGAVVLAVVVAAGIAAVLQLNRLLEANRERIVAEMSNGFARPVKVARITAGFHGGLAVALDGLRIGDDPDYSPGDFVAADRAFAIVRPWPLLRGRLEVRRIAVDAPSVTVIRGPRGLNVDSLGRRAAGGGGSGGTPATGGPPSAVPAVAVGLVNVEHGVVRFVDRTATPPRETTIAPLELHLSDVSFTTPVHVALDATLAGTPPTTVRLRGTVGPVGDPPFGVDVPIEQHVRIDGPALAVPDLTLAGTVRREATGAPSVRARVTAAEVHAAGVDVAGLDVTAVERDGVATLERLALRIFDGTVEGKGRVDHRGDAPGFALETAVRGLDVARAFAVRAPDLAARVGGRLDADWTIGGAGSDAAAVRRSLVGNGRAVVRGGVLRGVNVVDGVLSAATGVAGLVSLVPAGVRARHPAVFGSDETRFDELVSEVRIARERAHLDTLRVEASDYAMRGKGVVGFDRAVDLAATLVASDALTRDIAGAVHEARVLADADGRIAIPFRLTGTLPDVRPVPDADFVARVLRKALVEGTLNELLGKPKDKDRPGDKKNDLLQRGLDLLRRR